MKFGKSIFKTFFLSLCIIANTSFVYAQTASILPNAKTTFTDQNGKPLTSGTVDFYSPGTSIRKTTWQDSAETTPNNNPVILDGSGRALILGDGAYRQVVKDRNGNLIWDQVTSSLGSGSSGGTTVGDGLPVGSILPNSGFVAPANYQFAYGQALSRSTYSALYAALTITAPIGCIGGSPLINISDTSNLSVGAVLESICITGSPTIISKTSSTVTLNTNSTITVSTTGVFFPYGNGNALTTFNVPDLRGYVVAGRCNMGGIDCSVLNSTYFSSNVNNTPSGVNAKGGNQSKALSVANIPPYTPTGVISNSISQSTTGNQLGLLQTGSGSVQFGGGGAGGGTTVISNSNVVVTSTFTGASQGGSSTAFSLIQPTVTLNYVIKVLPDSNLTSSFGVASIGGMTGILACGSGVTCSANTISFSFVGVNSLQGMTGNITCGTGLTCSAGAISANGANPQVITSRTSAQALDLSIYTAVQTLGYASGGDGGGAAFKKLSPGTPFPDTYINNSSSPPTLVGGTAYTNGVYLGAPLGGGSGLGCSGQITVAGGAVTAVSLAVPCAGYKVGDVLTTPNSFIGGTGSGFTWTVTAISTPQASFTDAAGNLWQFAPNGMANALQFGCKGDWNGVDGSATNNSACIWSAMSWAGRPNNGSASAGSGNFMYVPRGAYMTCGNWNGTIYAIPVPAGVRLSGTAPGGPGGSVLVECATDSSGWHYIELCDSNALVGQFGCKVENITVNNLQVAVSTSGFASIYSNSGQQFVLAENVEVDAGLRSCVKYELGKGGAANAIWRGIDCVQNAASNPGFSFNSATTQNVLRDSVCATTGGASICVLNSAGRLAVDILDIEGYGIGLQQNGTIAGEISSYKNVQQQSGGCTTAATLISGNIPGNIIFENVSTGCPITITNGQPAGSNWTGNIRGPLMCVSGACAAAVP